MRPQAEKTETGAKRPEIYAYHDYRAFLKDWIQYRKKSERDFSLRELAKQSKLTVGYLSLVLSGKRGLSSEALVKMIGALGLGESEATYLELLRIIAESDSQEVRVHALERLQRFRNYQQRNSRELEVYRYLSHWYYVAIREMAALGDFRAEPKWIQERLRQKVSLREIEEALEFLKSHGFLSVREDGSAEVPDKDVDCFSGVFRLAIQQYHREMLSLASDSIDSVPPTDRNLLGSTLTIPAEDFEELKRLMADAMARVAEMGKSGRTGDTVYQVSFSSFPLTHSRDRRKS